MKMDLNKLGIPFVYQIYFLKFVQLPCLADVEASCMACVKLFDNSGSGAILSFDTLSEGFV